MIFSFYSKKIDLAVPEIIFWSPVTQWTKRKKLCFCQQLVVSNVFSLKLPETELDLLLMFIKAISFFDNT